MAKCKQHVVHTRLQECTNLSDMRCMSEVRQQLG